MNILSLTGGGCFCAAQAATLFHARGLRVDLFAGTSGGGAVALALAAGKSPAEVFCFFRKRAARIFSGRIWRRKLRAFIAPKYDDRELNAALHAFFGDRTCADLQTRALVTTHNLRTGQPETFFSPSHPHAPLWVLARCTMAAHTYFSSFDGHADGGLFNNDPSMAALETVLAHRIARLGEISMFALGSGQYVVNRTPSECNPARVSKWLGMILADTVDGAGAEAKRRSARIFLEAHGGRFDAFEFPHSDMDFDDPAVVAMVRRDWEPYIRTAAQRIDAFFSAPEHTPAAPLTASVAVHPVAGNYQPGDKP